MSGVVSTATLTAPAAQESSVALTAWSARLKLAFARRDGRTELVQREHLGPLRLLKPLYPEGDANCHAVIVHPPGGMVAGDELTTEVRVDGEAHGLVTTPGAQKWYRSANKGARARTTLTLDAASALEWLPQESIVFDGTVARQDLTIRLTSESKLFAWEMVCFGRSAREERFRQGCFRQTIAIERDGAPLWQEHTRLDGGDALLHSPIGWGGHTVTATAWFARSAATARSNDEGLLAAIRETISTESLAAASNPAPGFFVVKAMGDDAESVRELLISVWSRIRFDVFGLPPQRPRIWST
jgi:urease accessory protein